jgi:ADP-ribosylglycohydrolase
MRVAAAGWLAETATQVDEWAAAQAAVSHDHPEAIAGSIAVARAIFALRRGDSPEAVRAFVTTRFG